MEQCMTEWVNSLVDDVGKALKWIMEQRMTEWVKQPYIIIVEIEEWCMIQWVKQL